MRKNTKNSILYQYIYTHIYIFEFVHITCQNIFIRVSFVFKFNSLPTHNTKYAFSSSGFYPVTILD